LCYFCVIFAVAAAAVAAAVELTSAQTVTAALARGSFDQTLVEDAGVQRVQCAKQSNPTEFCWICQVAYAGNTHNCSWHLLHVRMLPRKAALLQQHICILCCLNT
jgi:hypothetical protein